MNEQLEVTFHYQYPTKKERRTIYAADLTELQPKTLTKNLKI